jgi:probable rRNA maturation factor
MPAAADKFSIRSTVKGKPPRLPFRRIKEEILGRDYELSVVFAGDAATRRLNRTYRSKDKPANVLSFPLSKTSGEIFLNLARATKEAPDFGDSPRSFIGFLFIHGLLHLKGLDHGRTMERQEREWRKRFNI